MTDKLDIKSMEPVELAGMVLGWGEKSFRARQIFSWLHKKNVCDFNEMTDLSRTFHDLCATNCYINSLKVKKKLVSSLDGTVKYLYELEDGNCVETVMMRYHYGVSLCISTQVGCRMGCHFCASTVGGLVRNLTASEMLDQVYHSMADSGERIGSIVLMGIGEPLDNFENVLRFLKLISNPDGYGLSLRHISLSTCGLIDGMYRLAEYKFPLTLSVSLHAPNNADRSALMPVNRKYPLEELVAACKNYFTITGRRISFEYALIDGKTDSPDQARELVCLLKGFPCHVNLIPINAVGERPYRRSGAGDIRVFQREIEKTGISATVRRELGTDIMAACGQLRHESAGTSN